MKYKHIIDYEVREFGTGLIINRMLEKYEAGLSTHIDILEDIEAKYPGYVVVVMTWITVAV